MPIERLQAPSGGINTDAAPDYVGAAQAPSLMNLLSGMAGKVVIRGQFVVNITGITGTAVQPDAFWSFNDVALIKGDPGGGTKTYFVDVNALTKTDETATLVESPLDYRHARYGNYVYGAIVDAASPQLGQWNGTAAAIVPQANAPFQWTDLQVYAQRLFILGGSVPGTTTPVVNGGRTLFWSDTPTAGTFADLSVLDSWKDDVSGLVNQLQYDADDTPVGLAGCGRFMAILGSRSINILTGSGSSSFAVRNLTRNWGCNSRNSILEVDDGFYFMSDRGFCFCDGTDVSVVSDPAVTIDLTSESPTNYTTAMFNNGYVALSNRSQGTCWLFHLATKSWTQISMDISGTVPVAVFRTNLWPIMWQSGGLRIADTATIYAPGGAVNDYDGSTITTIKSTWTSRFVRLASPGQLATVQRVLLDYKWYIGGVDDPNAWRVKVLDTLGNVLADVTAASQRTSDHRSRLVVDCYGEADAVQLVVTNAQGTSPSIFAAEIYDAWVEFVPAQQRGTI